MFDREGGVVGAVFLNLIKVFDLVSHNILVSKLSNFDFPGKTLANVAMPFIQYTFFLRGFGMDTSPRGQ